MGFEMRRASLDLWERLWEGDWNIAAVGMKPWGRDRAKGAPTLYQGWVGAAVWGLWVLGWHLHEVLWVCSPAKQELGQVSGMLVRLPKPGLTSAVVLWGAAQRPWARVGCCCISRLAGRGSVEPPSPAQSHAPCPTCPVCSPCPAGLHLGASCRLL